MKYEDFEGKRVRIMPGDYEGKITDARDRISLEKDDGKSVIIEFKVINSIEEI